MKKSGFIGRQDRRSESLCSKYFSVSCFFLAGMATIEKGRHRGLPFGMLSGIRFWAQDPVAPEYL